MITGHFFVVVSTGIDRALSICTSGYTGDRQPRNRRLRHPLRSQVAAKELVTAFKAVPEHKPESDTRTRRHNFRPQLEIDGSNKGDMTGQPRPQDYRSCEDLEQLIGRMTEIEGSGYPLKRTVTDKATRNSARR
ncbi:hypothetical protein SISNIDRAFT_469103 [Sistotremastrum niveocremeum HHB9708]|uniref:Uncharacterized protein n=1 Tax=Sistotremastrum niveocremeum HHB9708 TaxID=1314777 RepID=A0A164QE20_9AGAM|nr:hypothetical protein SISNIDRAFT_469103 [Sistotremastrum niveocremeum HHB9708]